MSADRLPRTSDDELEPLSELARAAALAAGSGAAAGPAWNRLSAAVAAEPRRRRARLLAASAGMTLLLAVAGRVVWHQSRDGGRITYTVEGAASGVNGYIPSVQGKNARLAFSDGSQVRLAQGGRAWVVSTGADGARLRLEEGRAELSVVHRAGTRWAVEAGPYVVAVTGTTLDVRWSGAADLLEVRLTSGAVTVQGPLAGSGVTLRPGQKLVARPGAGSLQIALLEAPAVTPAAPASVATGSPTPESRQESPPEAPVRPRRREMAHEPSLPRDVGGDWSREVAQGEFARVVQQAEETGIEGCLRSLPSERLRALADAARYAGRPDLATRALSSQRTRFAGTAAAHEAAFLLGRVAEDSGAGKSAALTWYEQYLAEDEAGTFAAEALARKMLMLRDLGQAGGARAAARDYLARHPAGPYVRQARQLLEGQP